MKSTVLDQSSLHFRVPASRFVARIKSVWRESGVPDAQAVFESFPSLIDNHSLAKELVFDEYRAREENGEEVDPDEFCQRYPGVARSVAKLIDVHKFVVDSPQTQAVLAGDYWPEIGELVLDKFIVKEELGTGAMARAYLCSQPAMGNREVVVKLSIGGGYEAATLGRLEHPHVVPVHSLDEDPDSKLSAICMPFRGRSTLTEILDEVWNPALSRPTSGAAIRNAAHKLNDPDAYVPDVESRCESFVDSAIQLGLQLASALQHAHDRNIRHDDLKPSNVLITPEGQALLMDFNLSNDCMGANRVTGGTLPYMSPEQLRAYQDPQLAAEIDIRSDVYALGVVLYELLSGRPPFGGTTEVAVDDACELMLQRRKTAPKPIGDLNPDVDHELSDCVMGCLAFYPADRPASAADWSAEAESLLAKRARRRPWARRHWRALVVIFLAAVMGTSVVAAGWRDAPRHGQRLTAQRPLGPTWLVEADRLAAEGKFVEAANRLLEVDVPDSDPRAHRRLGYCYHENKLKMEAHEAWLRAFKLGDHSGAVLNNLGRSYCGQLDYVRAEEFLDMALAKLPESPTVLYNIMWLDQRMSNRSFKQAQGENRPYYLPWKGLEAAEKLISIVEDNGLIYYRLAQLYAQIAKVNPAFESNIFDAIADSCRFGLARSYRDTASQHPLFSPFKDRLDFQAALRIEATAGGIPADIARVLP